MINLKARHKAVAIIDEVLELTAEEYLHRQIVEPLENSHIKFSFDKTVPFTHQNFIRITGELVQHIYKHGLAIKRTLSISQACREALAIIEKGYESQEVRGYDAAYLDASKPDGLEFVLTWITGFIITRTRDRHIKWIYTSRIDPIDWHTKCLMAEILLKQWGPFLPSGVFACTPSQLAPFLPDLFRKISSSDNIVQKSMSGGRDFFTSETSTKILPLFG